MIRVAHTTPYPWPYDGSVDPGCLALVLAGGGPWTAGRVPADPEAADSIGALRAAVRDTAALTVVIDHRPSTSRMTMCDDPSEPIVAIGDEVPVTAAGLDGFYGSSLDATLHTAGRTHLIVCGLGLETTVHSTLRRANDRGYECLLVADASAAHRPDLAPPARSSVEMSGGIFGAVGSTVDVVAALT